MRTRHDVRTLACVCGVAGCLALRAAAAENWRHYTQANGLPGNRVQFVKQDESGSVWIGTLTGLASYRDGKFEARIAPQPCWDLVIAKGGAWWAGTDNGVIGFSGGVWTTNLQGRTVAKIVPYGDAGFWALTRKRDSEQDLIVEQSGGDWKDVEAFADKLVSDIYRVRDGTLWVSFEGNGVAAFSAKEGPSKAVWHLAGLNVRTVSEDSKGRIWCGLWDKGVAVYDKGGWTRHLGKEKGDVLAVREDAKGAIWVATSGQGLWMFDGTKWTHDLADEGAISLLEATSDGRVWISSQRVGGLRYWDGSTWQVSLAGKLPMRCLIETRDKRIWAGGVLDGVYVK